jgi:hypothetical protein
VDKGSAVIGSYVHQTLLRRLQRRKGILDLRVAFFSDQEAVGNIFYER